MTADYVFPLRASPMPGESFLGYMQRLAQVNACDRVNWIAERADIDVKKVAVGGADPSPLAVKCLVDVSVLEQMRYLPIGKDVVLFKGEPLRRAFIRNNRPKVCGPCLGEAAYHRAVWDLAFVDLCPNHQVQLLSACQACGASLHWNAPSVTHCRCGADLTRQSGASVTAEDASVIRTIVDRPSQSLSADILGTDGASVDVFKLPLGEFVELVMFLGRNLIRLELGKSQSGRTLDRVDLMLVLRTGLDCCWHWPRRFHEMIDRSGQMQNCDTDIPSLTAQFGHLYRVVTRLKVTGWGSIVRKAFRDYLRAKPEIVCISGSRLLQDLDRETDFVTAKEAADLLGMNARALSRLMKSSAGSSIRSIRHGGRRLFRQQDVASLAQDVASVIDLKGLGQRLGIQGQRGVRSIFDSGVFETVDGAALGRKRSLAVVARDVDLFLRDLEHAAERRRPSGTTIRFRSALRSANEQGIGLAQFLIMLKRHDVEPVDLVRQARGLDRYLFDSCEVKAKLQAVVEAETGTISAAVAAGRLKTNLQAIYGLIEGGFLEPVELERTAPKGVRILSAAVSAFQSEFIDTACIARMIATNHRTTRAMLNRLSTAPQVVAVVGTKKTTFYRRASIDFEELKCLAKTSRRSGARHASARMTETAAASEAQR